MTSVCTGALILARAGVLHERAATIKNEFEEVVKEAGDPQSNGVKARWVVDGTLTRPVYPHGYVARPNRTYSWC